jgi:hypothetical protein
MARRALHFAEGTAGAVLRVERLEVFGLEVFGPEAFGDLRFGLFDG